MVKFNDLIVRLAVELDEPVGDFVEALRVLRLAAAGANDRRIEWADNARFSTLFPRKYGPGGGIETNAATVGFFLTAVLVEGPRRGMAELALDIQFAVAAVSLLDKRTVCPQRYFGAALANVLSDRALFDDLKEIQVCTKVGLAALVFKKMTSIFLSQRLAGLAVEVSQRQRPYELGVMHRIAHLPVNKIRFIFDLINPEPAAPVTTRRRKVRIEA